MLVILAGFVLAGAAFGVVVSVGCLIALVLDEIQVRKAFGHYSRRGN